MPNLIRHLFGYLPVNLVAALVAFGGVFVFTRLLGADEYGRYALALSTMHLMHTFTLTWVEAAGYRFNAEAEAKGGLPHHYRTALTLSMVSFLPAFLVLGIVWFMVSNAPEFRSVLPWLLILMPVSTIANLAQQSHKAAQRIKRYSAVEMGRVLGGFTIGVGLAAFAGFGAAAPLAGMTVAFSIAGLTEGYWLWKGSRGGQVSKSDARRYFAYGFPISAALVLDLILSASDRFLIALFIDEAAVGAYAAGYGVADKTVLMLCAWAAMAGSPLIMAAFEKDGKEAAEKAARSMAQSMILIAIPAAAGIALTAGPLAGVMIGEDLRAQARHIIPWIAFAGLFNGMLIHYFSEAFQLAHKTAERALIMLIPAGLNIVLNIILLPRLGLMGAVYATVGCYFAAVVLLALLGRRHVALPVPLADLGKVLIACAAMAGVVNLIPDLSIDLIELVLEAGFGVVAYALCVASLDAAGARGMALKLIDKVRSRLKGGQAA
ncbi:lipopolysaccharide biosynthesis protein [Ponticaulis sp.]|uniref:lipopolysaccharide biosynthesis protein n=1 Tax=Ponticaulis sp. TaxID=2020902 RepID=UPI0025E6CE67|nr:lipopolysaccharide biosynthesis protein [Ponticaulis sp.]